MSFVHRHVLRHEADGLWGTDIRREHTFASREKAVHLKEKAASGKSDAAYTDRCNGLCRAENAMDHFLAWQVESPAQLVAPVLRFGQSVQSPKPVVAPLVGPESE